MTIDRINDTFHGDIARPSALCPRCGETYWQPPSADINPRKTICSCGTSLRWNDETAETMIFEGPVNEVLMGKPIPIAGPLGNTATDNTSGTKPADLAECLDLASRIERWAADGYDHDTGDAMMCIYAALIVRALRHYAVTVLT